jgi:Ribosomal L29e protein family
LIAQPRCSPPPPPLRRPPLPLSPRIGSPGARAGIKKPAKQRYRSTAGVDPKFLRNARYAKHGQTHLKELARKKVKAVVEKAHEA